MKIKTNCVLFHLFNFIKYDNYTVHYIQLRVINLLWICSIVNGSGKWLIFLPFVGELYYSLFFFQIYVFCNLAAEKYSRWWWWNNVTISGRQRNRSCVSISGGRVRVGQVGRLSSFQVPFWSCCRRFRRFIFCNLLSSCEGSQCDEYECKLKTRNNCKIKTRFLFIFV